MGRLPEPGVPWASVLARAHLLGPASETPTFHGFLFWLGGKTPKIDKTEEKSWYQLIQSGGHSLCGWKGEPRGTLWGGQERLARMAVKNVKHGERPQNGLPER